MKAKSDQQKQHEVGAQTASIVGSGDVPAEKHKVNDKTYEKELARLQIELVKLQEWVKHEGLKVVLIFEGRDAAGKGGVIKRLTERVSPRVFRTVALPAPTERQRSQMYFQRYMEHFPAAGEVIVFDRSWYNRAGVERVMDFCTDTQYERFLRLCPMWEREMVNEGIILVKYFFDVSQKEQERRFLARITDPMRQWKLSPMDVESRKLWVEYSKAKDDNFAHTDIKQAPWYVVNSDIKKHARLNCISHLLSLVDYQDLTPRDIDLSERPKSSVGYVRPPIDDQEFVPEVF